ncbi:hypothetical protein MMC24_001675 [Lignoscripta atroalba]|nr:hypothetical protein [Lignoscripta atroalba]
MYPHRQANAQLPSRSNFVNPHTYSQQFAGQQNTPCRQDYSGNVPYGFMASQYPMNAPYTKTMTCPYWARDRRCVFSDTECRYAHFYTSQPANLPAQVQFGRMVNHPPKLLSHIDHNADATITPEALNPVYNNLPENTWGLRGNDLTEPATVTKDVPHNTPQDLRRNATVQSPQSQGVTTPLRPTAVPFVPDSHVHLEQSVGILAHVVEEQHAALKAQAKRIEVLQKVIVIQNAGLVTSQGVADRARRVLLPEGNFEDEIEAIIDAEINLSQLIGSTRDTADTELEGIGMQDVLKSS